MKANMGYIDRSIRSLAASALGALYFNEVITGTLGTVGLVIAGIFFITAVIGVCPLYSILNISTKGEKLTRTE